MKIQAELYLVKHSDLGYQDVGAKVQKSPIAGARRLVLA